jgi:hypothetical protein
MFQRKSFFKCESVNMVGWLLVGIYAVLSGFYLMGRKTHEVGRAQNEQPSVGIF